jgi:hypothetical protein
MATECVPDAALENPIAVDMFPDEVLLPNATEPDPVADEPLPAANEA